LPAQLESAFRLVGERDVDDREVGEPRSEGPHGLGTVGVAAHRVALTREGGGVVVADGRFILDDGDEAFHAQTRLQAARVL